MNPQSGTTISAHIEATSAEQTAETGSAVVPVEQFIWEDAPAPAAATAPEDGILENPAPTPEPSGDDEALTRIVVLSEDEEQEETSDSWRRQLISALRDADRDATSAKARPTEPPPIPPAEIPRRPPIVLAASRQGRGLAPLPVERRPRHRVAPVLFSISAAAGLLTIAVPRTANTPEMAADTATSAQIVTGSLIPASGDAALKPIIVNSPVLIREVTSEGPQAALPVGPVIETVRTVPVQIGAPPPTGAQMSEATSPIGLPAVAPELPQPPPTAAPALDRERLAALIYDEPAAPPAPRATVAPLPAAAPAEPAEKAASAPRETHKPAKARSPQVSSAYQRSIREKPRAKSASKKRAATKTVSRSSDRAKWDTRRQGLRTTEVKEVEPSTMVKLLKSLNPFAAKEEPQARPKKNIFE
jgi:hypothetical protein